MAATVPYKSSSSFTIGPLELETTAGDSQDDVEDTTGRAAWTAGCKLAELLLLEDKHAVHEWFPPGVRVLELGCGCGVGGCAVAARDPTAHVLFTDSNTACLDTAARNAAPFGARTSTAVLKWGDADAASKIATTGRLVRVIRSTVRGLQVLRVGMKAQQGIKKGATAARMQVSMNKKRFLQQGFNLDLSFINQRLIAMSVPAVGKAQMYRNPLPEVARFFETFYGPRAAGAAGGGWQPADVGSPLPPGQDGGIRSCTP